MPRNNLYVNRLLNMRKIKYIGLDMDHTLIRYHTANFESLVYSLTIEKLIEVKHYPEHIRSFQFEYNDTIRGLIIDSKHGNIIKLSRFGAIRRSYHGTKAMSFEEQQHVYRTVYVDLNDKNFIAIDTSFSLAFCVLYSQLVDYCDAHPGKMPDYVTLAEDVGEMVDRIHADGSLKKTIAENLETYIVRDEALVTGLKRYIRHGKKFFILTNSDYHYTKMLLDFAITPYLEEDEHWLDLFEYVITLASKPRFFYDDLKFLRVDKEHGYMTNFFGPITPGIYQGGCSARFTRDTGLSGDDILYLGDHIYGDILRLKKDCNWRTALVVDDLGSEVEAIKKARPIERRIRALMKEKVKLEERSLSLFSHAKEEASTEGREDLVMMQINEIDTELAELITTNDAHFNQRWGSVFRIGAEESFFAYQVERFACIYMEKLTDLLEHSPRTYFRASLRELPHEMLDE